MKYIAITQRVLQNKKTGELRDALDQQWTVLLEQIGFIPLIIPNMLTPLSKLLKITLLSGVLFTGGNDIGITKTQDVALERDRTEKRLLSHTLKHRIPLIGVCRGMQFIVHQFGGKLKKSGSHIRNKHPIVINKSSRYTSELKKISLVNSYHNYVVVSVPQEFKVIAHASDGTIEAIEHKS